MNYRKAIDIIENNYPKTTKMVNGRYQGGFDNHESDFGKALDKACEALEKQIQRKVIRDGTDDMDFIRCPQCENILGQIGDIYIDDCYQKYCDRCGQALDWSDV